MVNNFFVIVKALLVASTVMVLLSENTEIKENEMERVSKKESVGDFCVTEQTKEDISGEDITEETKEIITMPIMVRYIGEFGITAYCPCEKCCGQWSKNRPVDEHGNEIVVGSTGEVLTSGYSVAVDPNVIPYGTEIIFDGVTYKAQDCGGAIKGNRIDVFFSDHETALEFGIKRKNVYAIGGLDESIN